MEEPSGRSTEERSLSQNRHICNTTDYKITIYTICDGRNIDVDVCMQILKHTVSEEHGSRRRTQRRPTTVMDTQQAPNTGPLINCTAAGVKQQNTGI